MIKLRQAVIVEGKYDKITLENIIDAIIIQTNGFSIFKDREKCEYIRRVAKKRGIIVITDSDSAGAQIRSFLKGICPEGSITNVYIPQLNGKEKRKNIASKEGYLGVEGMSKEIITEALNRSGVTNFEENANTRKITKTDFFELGLSGVQNSSFLRENLAMFLKLPNNISSNAFLDAVNSVFSYEEFISEVEKWRQEEGKR